MFKNAIYLYDDKVVIYYNLKDSKQVSYIEMLDSLEEPPNGNPYNMNESSHIERSALPNYYKSELGYYFIFVKGLFGAVFIR